MHLVAVWLLGIAGGGLTLLTFGGFLGRFCWLFDVFTHFILQTTALLALCFGLGWFVYPEPATTLWLLPALGVSLARVVPYFWPVGSSPEKPLRVLTLNVLAEHDNTAEVAYCILEAEADLVLLAEVEPDFLAKLRTALTPYPYLHDAAQPGYLGLVMFSKLPFARAHTHHLGLRGHPSVEVTLTWQGRAVTVYGAHPYPPLGPRSTYRRDSELAAVGRLLADVATPLVLMGDLNATPWSSALRGLTGRFALRGAGPRDSADLAARLLGVRRAARPRAGVGSLAGRSVPGRFGRRFGPLPGRGRPCFGGGGNQRLKLPPLIFSARPPVPTGRDSLRLWVRAQAAPPAFWACRLRVRRSPANSPAPER